MTFFVAQMNCKKEPKSTTSVPTTHTEGRSRNNPHVGPNYPHHHWVNMHWMLLALCNNYRVLCFFRPFKICTFKYAKHIKFLFPFFHFTFTLHCVFIIYLIFTLHLSMSTIPLYCFPFLIPIWRGLEGNVSTTSTH